MTLVKKLKFVYPLVLLFPLLSATSLHSDWAANRLLGVWESEEKSLRIEMFAEDGHYAGRMVWFHCTLGQSLMCSYLDTENPNPRLTNRPLIGLKVVEKISYQGPNTWGSGKIYDPNSGHTYDAGIRLISPNTVIVRGYWKFKWLGKSMVFNRMGSGLPSL